MISLLFNMGLRFGSLAAKMLLVLYIGRFLSLQDMGTYGLVVATVAIAASFLGIRLAYVAGRDIVDASPTAVVSIIRDQSVFYGLNYLLVAVVYLIVLLLPVSFVQPSLAIPIILISILESYATTTADNLFALKKPTTANIIHFLRSGLWPFPAMALGYYFPGFRNIETILSCWIIGVLMGLGLTAFALRHYPWEKIFEMRINWKWIWRGVKICAPIWIGAICVSLSQYVERFIVEFFLGREFVGIISFYGSFTGAVFTLMLSSVFSFSYPHLISHHQKGDAKAFRGEAKKMTLEAGGMAAVMVFIVGAAVPMLGPILKRPELMTYNATLWLMLAGIWIRCVTESIYYMLYARHEDKMIWTSNLVTLIPAVGFNILFLPLFGLQGVGYSAIATALFSGMWRYVCLRRSFLTRDRMKGDVLSAAQTMD